MIQLGSVLMPCVHCGAEPGEPCYGPRAMGRGGNRRRVALDHFHSIRQMHAMRASRLLEP